MATDMSNLTITHCSPSPPVASDSLVRFLLSSVEWLLFAVGCLNVLVVAVVVLRPAMRTVTNIYIVHLCLADYGFLAILSVVAAVQQHNDGGWAYGVAVCKLYFGLEAVCKYASVLFVSLLALDRYCAVCRREWELRWRCVSTSVGACVVVWVVCVIYATPLFAYAHTFYVGRCHVMRCMPRWPSFATARCYILVSFVTMFAIPLAFIVLFNASVMRKVREATVARKRTVNTPRRTRPYLKVNVMVSSVIAFYLLCWTPFWVFNVWSAVYPPSTARGPIAKALLAIMNLLPHVNCALNPVLYAFHSDQFRRAIWTLVCNQPETTGRRNQPPLPRLIRNVCSQTITYNTPGVIRNVTTARNGTSIQFNPADDIML